MSFKEEFEMKLLYKLSKSVIPCILLTLCIGFCYAFSLFTPHIATALGCSVGAVQFTFCLNIFFLGMGAATFGPLVEKRIKVATFTSALMLMAGLIISGIACRIGSLPLIYIGSGVLCGLAEGCGYVAPNKNMLLWFPMSKARALIMAISIFSFGLGSTICSWLFGLLFPSLGISGMFFALAAIYAFPTFIAGFLIQKPRYALIEIKKRTKSLFSYLETLKSKFFRCAWLFMFLNISMGLILIGSCAGILAEAGFSPSNIILVMMLCGIFNGAGRLVFPAISDIMSSRVRITGLIVIIEIICVLWSLQNPSFVPISIILINACYGAGFSCLPSILENYYGKKSLSQIHGFCLTSWGMASVMAFLCTMFILGLFSSFKLVMVLLLVGYMVNFFVSLKLMTLNQNKLGEKDEHSSVD